MNRTIVAIIVAAGVLAGGLLWLPMQRPYDGRPEAELLVVPELSDPPTRQEIDAPNLIGAFEALATLAADPPAPGARAQMGRYTRALLERYPESSHKSMTGEVSLAAWRIVPSPSSGGRLWCLLYARATPTQDLNIYIHSVGDEKTLPLFPEYWRKFGMVVVGVPVPHPLTSMAPGSFLVVSADLARIEADLPVRVGLMDEKSVGVGTAVELGSHWHGVPRADPEPVPGLPALVEVRRRGAVVVGQPAVLTPGVLRVPIGRGSTDTSEWDQIVLAVGGGDGGPALVRLAVRDNFSRAAAEARVVAGSTLAIGRAGSEFERSVRRWRIAAPVLAGLLGAVVFTAFLPSGPGRVARCVLVVIALIFALRLLKAENVLSRPQWWVVLASDGLIAGVVAWMLTKIGCALGIIPCERDPAPLALRSRWRAMVLLFAIFAAPLLVWFVGEWPGCPGWDESEMLDNALNFKAHSWLSTSFSVYAVSILRVFGQYTVIAVVNIAILSWALADLFSLVLAMGVRRVYVLPFVALLATSIPLGLTACNMTHDILTAFLKIVLAVALLNLFVRSRLLRAPGGTGAALRYVGVLTLLVSCLRTENVALLAFIPLLLLLTRQARPAAVLGLIAALVGGTFLYRGVVRPGLDGPQVRETDMYRRYGLYLLYGPVGFMVKHNYYSPTPEEDRRAIADVIDYDALVGKYNAFTFLDYVQATKPYVSKEQQRAFERVYVSSAINNPGLFLAHRLMVFMRCIEGHPHTWYNFVPHREAWTDAQLCAPPYTGFFPRHGMAFERENPSALSRVTHRLRDLSYPAGFRSPGYYLWNAIPALGLMLLGLLSFRRLPVTASVCGVVGAPLALLILAAPQGQFKYIADLYILGFLIVPIVLLEAGPLRRLNAPRAVGGGA